MQSMESEAQTMSGSLIELNTTSAIEFAYVPQGEFSMGRPEPKPPSSLFQIGVVTSTLLALILIALVVRSFYRAQKRNAYSYSLRGLLYFLLNVAGLLFALVCVWEGRNEQLAYRQALEVYLSADTDEKPPHTVRISKPFYISRHEITQGQFQELMEVNYSTVRGENRPVNNVSKTKADRFCKRLSRITGRIIRLPTEAEWEYCAQMNSTINQSLDAYAWHIGNSNQLIQDVGQLDGGRLGIYDLIGNVAEWCSDGYDPEFYRKSPEVDPTGSLEGDGYVLRGGSYFWGENLCNMYSRRFYDEGDQSPCFGFRIVMEMDEAVAGKVE